MSSGHQHSASVSFKGQNHKAQLANAYNELGKELSSTKIKVVGNYTLGKVIGEGTYGKVRLGTHRLTSTRVAVKQIPKAMSSSLTREIHHHRQLHHPHVTQMYEVIATESSIWIVTELCSGGELFDYLVEKGRLSEDETRLLFGQLCLAVAYLHDMGIVHRDLKLENILLDERCRIKLGDFGFTREFERGSFMETFCGTTGYASPEMLQGKKYQGPEVDIWSLGVILYTLLTGTLPFDDDDESVMREMIIKGEFEDPEWLSTDSRDLTQKILQKDPLRRLTIRQILSHPWFAPRAPLLAPRGVSISPPSSPGPHQSTSLDIDRSLESTSASRTSDISILASSTDFASSASTTTATTLEDIHLNTLDTPKPNGVDIGTSTLFSSSDATLPRTDSETYEEFSTRMAPRLKINLDNTQNHLSETVDNNINGLTPDSSALRSLSQPISTPWSSGSKSHPPSSIRTPVRTKRRSVSSNLSDSGSPTTDNHQNPNTTTTTTNPTNTPQYPYQDFASLLSTPAPIIFSSSLERDLLTRLSALGFDTAQIVHSVLSDACDAAGAMWWMLKRKAEKKAMGEAAEGKIAETEVAPGQVAAAESKSSSSSNQRSAPATSSTVSVSVQTDIVAIHSHALSATRSAPQLAFVPPTPTFAPPETPPKPRSPTQTHLSPSPTLTAAGSSSRSHPSTPSGSLRDRDRDKEKGEGVWPKGKVREGKARSGSVSIMQRATTALEAAGLVKKKSSEGVREEREREKSKESDRRLASAEEPRSSYGSSSSKLVKSAHGHGKSGKDTNSPAPTPATTVATPSTPPSDAHHTQMGSPWVVTEAQPQSPPRTGTVGAPTPANSPGDPFMSPSPSGNNITSKHGGGIRHRASLLTTFRLWFNDDRKGKRKDPNMGSGSTSAGAGTSRTAILGNRVSMIGSSGTVKRRTSGSAGHMSSRKVNHRSQRPSISSRRSSSANSRRSSAASAQIMLLDPPLVIEQMPTRRSIGSRTPNSERGGDFPSSRPSSVRSLSGQQQQGQVHRKSPSVSSASSAHFRTASPMQKYPNHHHNHKRAGSGSSTRVVRQIHPTHHHHHHHGPRHGRSNSATSSLHTPTSSRPTSFYEFPSATEGDGPIPRNASPFRPSGGRRSLDETRSNSGLGGGNSIPTTTTTFVAQKRQAPFMSPSGGGGGGGGGGHGHTSLGRSSWKKSWGLEPPGWQSRTAHFFPVEVLAVSPATGPPGAGVGVTSEVRDVFSGKGSMNLGDESDWVDEDDDFPAFAGGLGQSTTTTTTSSLAMMVTSSDSNNSGSISGSSGSGSGSFATKMTVESSSSAAIQLSAPPGGRRGMKRGGGGGGGSMSTINAAATRQKPKPGHSPIERPSQIPVESGVGVGGGYEASELRGGGGGRRQLPSGRSGPAFRHAIQEEDEGEEE